MLLFGFFNTKKYTTTATAGVKAQYHFAWNITSFRLSSAYAVMIFCQKVCHGFQTKQNAKMAFFVGRSAICVG